MSGRCKETDNPSLEMIKVRVEYLSLMGKNTYKMIQKLKRHTRIDHATKRGTCGSGAIRHISVKVAEAVSVLSCLLLLFMLSGCQSSGTPSKEGIRSDMDSLELWYTKPAAKWTDALPVGNGHIGAMIFGGADSGHIQFNESTLWTGRPRAYAHPGAARYLPKIRSLLFEGKQKQAQQLAEAHFMGIKSHDPDKYQVLKKAWLAKVRKDTTAARFDLDDTQWKTMTLPLINGWETAGLEGVDGALWFRVRFDLPKDWEGKDVYVDLGRIRDQDYCYVNGHYAGHDAGISSKRHYLLKSEDLRPGKNVLAIQVINFYDKGGFTGVKNDRPIFVLYPADKTPKEGIAVAKTWKYWIQDQQPPATPQYEASYQPFGDIYIEDLNPGDVSDYRRSLNLRQATSSLSYKKGDVRYTRKYFSSASDPVMAVQLTADQAARLHYKIRFSSLHKNRSFFKIDDHTIGMKVQVKGGALHGYSALRVEAEGSSAKVAVSDSAAVITQADKVNLYLVAATNFKSYKDVSGKPDALCHTYLEQIKRFSYDQLYERHQSAYHQLFDNFDLHLGDEASIPDMPTDERIQQFSVKTDPGLIRLYVQYARYLMISASPPGGRAANLQGIWNNLLTPPWESKYTTNINTEMNYWPAELLNLSACTEPLFSLLKDISKTGAVTAKEQYGASGWVEHHNTDIWAATAPIDAAKHGIWVGGSGWLCHHLWEHYLFTKDTAFLKKEGYPIMKKAAQFYADFLIQDPKTGYLISSPSNSPEHGGLVAGPTMDHQIIRDLFSNCIAAAKVLGTDSAFSRILSNKYDSIAPNQIGQYGQLQEWMQDIDDTADTHRHVSHLWGVYPGNDISWDKDSAMMRAARQSAIYRGDAGTGWSVAWKVNLWARFKSGNHALKLLKELLRPAEGASGRERGGVYHNMMDAHPPFQIDGNFGGAAGVAEMLLQSQNGYIDLLPALPDSLSEGWVRGICARGGFKLDMAWAGGKLSKVVVHATTDGNCVLRYGAIRKSWPAEAGQDYTLDGALVLQ